MTSDKRCWVANTLFHFRQRQRPKQIFMISKLVLSEDLGKLRMLVRNTNNLNSVTLIKCILIFNLAFKKSASSDLKTSDMTNLKIYRNFFIEESPNLSVQFQVGSLEAKQKPILSFKFRVNVWCSLA